MTEEIYKVITSIGKINAGLNKHIEQVSLMMPEMQDDLKDISGKYLALSRKIIAMNERNLDILQAVANKLQVTKKAFEIFQEKEREQNH